MRKFSFIILLIILVFSAFINPTILRAAAIERIAVKCTKINVLGTASNYNPEYNSFVIQYPAKSVDISGQVSSLVNVSIYKSVRNNQQPAQLLKKTGSNLEGNFFYTDFPSLSPHTMYVYSSTFDINVIDSPNRKTVKESSFTPLRNAIPPGCIPLVGLQFVPPTPTPTPRPRIDPYGIVFDSASGEPIEGTEVTLLGENKFVYVDPKILNPFTTSKNGKFFFLPPAGTYYLSVKKAGYLFPSLNKKITNPNYFDLYYQDPIYVKQDIEHRDIPLDSIGNPQTAYPQILSYFIFTDGQVTEIHGETSHPHVYITAFQNNKFLGEIVTSRGFFNLIIPNSQINFSLPIDLSASKNSLKSEKLEHIISSSLVRKVIAAETGVQVFPIITSLSGFALDRNGNIIPNAQVRLIDKTTGGLLDKLKADTKGYFKVPLSSSPRIPYFVETRLPESDIPEALWEPKDIAADSSTSGQIRTGATAKPIWPVAPGKNISQIDLPSYYKELTSLENTTDGSSDTASKYETSKNRPDSSYNNSNLNSNSPSDEISGKSKKQKPSLLGLIAIIIVFLFYVGIIIYFIRKKKRASGIDSPSEFNPRG